MYMYFGRELNPGRKGPQKYEFAIFDIFFDDIFMILGRPTCAARASVEELLVNGK